MNKYYFSIEDNKRIESSGVFSADEKSRPQSTLGQKDYINFQFVNNKTLPFVKYTQFSAGTTARFLVDVDYQNPGIPIPLGNTGWNLSTGAEYKKILSSKPDNVTFNDIDATEGTVGSLTAGQWGYIELSNEIVVRLSDDTDPSTKDEDYIEVLYINEDATPLYIEASSDVFNLPNSWLDDDGITLRTPDITQGETSFFINSNTVNFYNRLGGSNKSDGFAEIQLFEPGTALFFMKAKFAYICTNRLLSSGEDVLEITGIDVYTKAETQALVNAKMDFIAIPVAGNLPKQKVDGSLEDSGIPAIQVNSATQKAALDANGDLSATNFVVDSSITNALDLRVTTNENDISSIENGYLPIALETTVEPDSTYDGVDTAGVGVNFKNSYLVLQTDTMTALDIANIVGDGLGNISVETTLIHGLGSDELIDISGTTNYNATKQAIFVTGDKTFIFENASLISNIPETTGSTTPTRLTLWSCMDNETNKAIWDKLNRVKTSEVSITSEPGATFTNMNDWTRHSSYAFVSDGGTITENIDETIDVDTVDCFLRGDEDDHSFLISVTIPADTNIALVDESVNTVLANYNAGDPIFSVTQDVAGINLNDKTPVATVVRAGGELYCLNFVGLGVNALAKIARKEYFLNKGLTYGTGLKVSHIGTLNINVTAGRLYNVWDPIEFTTGFDTSTTDTFTAVYGDSTNGYNRTIGNTAVDYNKYYDTTTDALITVGASPERWLVHWVYAVANMPNKLLTLYGRTLYTSLLDAQDETIPSDVPVEVGDYSTGELLAKIITSSANAVDFEDVQDYTEVAITVSGGGGTSIHNDLSGLQGGTVAQYYHVTSAEYSAVQITPLSENLTPATTLLTTVWNPATLTFEKVQLGNIPVSSSITVTDTVTSISPISTITFGAGFDVTDLGSANAKIDIDFSAENVFDTFVDGDLTAGILTITHTYGIWYPSAFSIYDNNSKLISPPADDVTITNNTITVDLSSFGTLTGTWRYAAGNAISTGIVNNFTNYGNYYTANSLPLDYNETFWSVSTRPTIDYDITGTPLARHDYASAEYSGVYTLDEIPSGSTNLAIRLKIRPFSTAATGTNMGWTIKYIIIRDGVATTSIATQVLGATAFETGGAGDTTDTYEIPLSTLGVIAGDTIVCILYPNIAVATPKQTDWMLLSVNMGVS